MDAHPDDVGELAQANGFDLGDFHNSDSRKQTPKKGREGCPWRPSHNATD
jgi:hypothetical protein